MTRTPSVPVVSRENLTNDLADLGPVKEAVLLGQQVAAGQEILEEKDKSISTKPRPVPV